MRKLDAKHEFIQQNVPISSLAWLRVGGPIEYLATPRSEEELVAALQMCREDGVDARPLGDGASVIASEPGAPGLAVKLSEPAFTEIRFESTRVVAGAGVKLG
ncbi:MAG: FAD-binding protein, partial [Thermoguttaceae bacterium]|nr:FAD-binding protein [Thermoguttaceae bacterium]